MLVKETKKIDSKGRLLIPKSVLKLTGLENAEVYFDVSRSGNLVLRKIKQDDKEKPTSLK